MRLPRWHIPSKGRAVFSDDEVARYARHLVLKEVGGPGQQALKRATVALVGMGGIGAPAALYLAAAGVGCLILIDPDTVDLSNLQRQVIYDTSDAGSPKVERAAARLSALNPHVRIARRASRLDEGNVEALLEGADLVIDGTDDFATRLIVSDACVRSARTLVSAALGPWQGQIGVFTGQPCYRCLMPEVPPDAETCERAGVIGALAGMMGALAALEAIKLITGAGEPLRARLLIHDALSGTSRTVVVSADPHCRACAQGRLD